MKVKNVKLPDGLTQNGFDFSSQDDNHIDLDKLDHIVEYIEMWFDKTKTIRKRQSSYGLKHLIERNTGTYISNGDLIAAMIICGYRYQKDGINCYFNVTTNE